MGSKRLYNKQMEKLHSIHMHRTTVSSDIVLLKAAGFEIMAERRHGITICLIEPSRCRSLSS